jgi:drug/metabolite transporter (DMT)-like permease
MVYTFLVSLECALAASLVGGLFWTLGHPPGPKRRRRRASGTEAIWLWLGTALLVVAGAVLSVAATVHGQSKQALWASGGFVVAYVLGFLAVVCVVAAIRRVPFPPWAKATFPDIEVEFLGWLGAVEDEDGNVWRAHLVSIFNLESNRVAKSDP